ncbi:MAG: hypothetical protein CBC13_06100 [Planctomycetia bacterium TMED53]|nr:MAG: hypothetical protein CBC13_06100 [Planctomycetia bacterium TMED53]
MRDNFATGPGPIWGPWVLFTLALSLLPICIPSWLPAQHPPFIEDSSVRGITVYTSSVGTFGSGLALVDFDSDGDPDLIATAVGSALKILENDGAGYFIDRTPPPGTFPIVNPSCVAAGDIDGDQDLDLYVGCHNSPDAILLNQGDLNFTPHTWTTPTPTPLATRTTGVTFCDLNGDQWLDLVVSCGSAVGQQSWNQLYYNDQSGFFIPAPQPILQLVEPTFQIMPHDYDLDGDLDLYISNDRGIALGFVNRFLINNDSVLGTYFSNISSVSVDSMGVCTGDINLDGLPDIYVTNTTSPHPLLINRGNFVFEDLSVEYGVNEGGVSWGCLFMDHGLDGDLDLLVADSSLPDRFFEQGQTTPWEDMAPELGLNVQNFSSCWVKGDIDNDGDIDLINQSSFDYLKVFLHPDMPDANYFKFEPLFMFPNYHAIGSKIEVYGNNMKPIFFDQKTTGRHYKSESEWIFHHGVPEGHLIEMVRVIYPDGSKRSFSSVPMNKKWKLPHQHLLGDEDDDRKFPFTEFFEFCTMRTTSSNPIQSGFEFYDFDANFVIDSFDLLALVEKAEWQQSDCNGNGVMDLLEIFLGDVEDFDQNGVPDSCNPNFIRGDLNLDLIADVADGILLLEFLFLDSPISCLSAADLTTDDQLDVADFAYLATFLFSAGSPPPMPFPICGSDFSILSCESPPCP